MKKLLLSSLMFVLVAIMIGCSSSMDRDATKMAKRVIELEQVQKRMGDRSNLYGKPMSKKEYEQYSQEYIEYANKMIEKYSETREQRQEFFELVDKKVKEMKNK
ncbi:MAG: hypothetical protein IJK92_05795 [Bacteroidales bacterium]|nr:hypothetical protein [Bacteroidales bacterium]